MMHGCPDLVILRCCGNKRMLGYGDIGKVIGLAVQVAQLTI